MFTPVQKFGSVILFNVSEKAFPAHQGCIYLFKNTVKIMKYYYTLKQLFLYEYVLSCNLFL